MGSNRRIQPAVPSLSVVMPVHEGSEWIGTTLESLTAEHDAPIEVILIDSSPTSATADVAKRFASHLPLRLLHRPDLTPWQTKTNLGVELATAEHVCILHQDDLWLPGRLEAARAWIKAMPEVVLHLAPSLFIDRHGKRIGRWTCPLPAEQPLQSEFMLERLLVQNFVSVPAAVFRRSAWLATGGMDAQLWYTPDWDIWLKLTSVGPVAYHLQPTTAFRIHDSSLTVTGSCNLRDFRRQLEVVLDRHLDRLPARTRPKVEQAARASIEVNISLAAASRGSGKELLGALWQVLSLGPANALRYLRDSRLRERVLSRARAKIARAF